MAVGFPILELSSSHVLTLCCIHQVFNRMGVALKVEITFGELWITLICYHDNNMIHGTIILSLFTLSSTNHIKAHNILK